MPIDPDIAARSALLRPVVADLGEVVITHTRRMEAGRSGFPMAQSIMISALMLELARVIAAGHPRLHRAHTKVVANELARLVTTAAVEMGPIDDLPEQWGLS